MANKVKTFLNESKEEFARVSWPTTKQPINLTILVVVLGTALTVFFMGLDSVFGKFGTFVQGLIN